MRHSEVLCLDRHQLVDCLANEIGMTKGLGLPVPFKRGIRFAFTTHLVCSTETQFSTSEEKNRLHLSRKVPIFAQTDA